jgi:hypothetical protein
MEGKVFVKHELRGVLKSIRVKVWTVPLLSQTVTDTAMETSDTVPEIPAKPKSTA